MVTATGNAYLELVEVSRLFGRIEAVAGVSLRLELGEVLAVVGDNGAGKSTLMSMITGLQRPSAGRIVVRGSDVSFASPSDAAAAGITAVTQDLALVECLDVATNMFIGRLPGRWGLVDRRAMEREARRFLDGVQATVPDLRTPIGMLSGGQRQMVAIARALRSGAQAIVMDEPTAALGVRETAQVAVLVAGLKAQGKAIAVVSHDLEFVFDVADRIQVMRRGRGVAAKRVAETSRPEIVGLITGAIAGEGDADA